MAKLSVLIIGLLAEKDQKPLVIDDLKNGQGTFHYNHNLKEVLVIEDENGGVTITEDEKKATGKRWQYDSLRVEFPGHVRTSTLPCWMHAIPRTSSRSS